jgi:peroxiredoxin Q/BCP
MPHQIKVGEPMPQFHVKDHDGYFLTDEDLLGTPLVIFFYPKDSTPGCTKQACSFQSNMDTFDKLDVLVLGVSSDDLTSHNKFIKDNKLEFTLLCDTEKKMAESFGVIKDGKPERTTFLIDATGVIRWMEKVTEIEGHIERVIKAVHDHIPPEGRSELIGDVEKNYKDFLKESINKKPKK